LQGPKSKEEIKIEVSHEESSIAIIPLHQIKDDFDDSKE